MTREQQIAAEVAARYGCPVPDTAVQVLPVGKSVWQAPFWDPKINRLRYPDAEARKRAAHAEHYILGRNVAAARAAEVRTARRKEVARLHSEGVWSSEIARRLDVCPTTVSDDLAALGLNPVKPPPGLRRRKTPHVVAPEIIARNARIAELAALGWSSEQIGQAVGFTRQTVNAVAAKLGIEIKRKERPIKQSRPEVSRAEREAAEIARRAEVRRLIEKGQCARDIAQLVGVTTRTVARDARAMDLCLPVARSPRRPGSRAMAEIAEQRADRRGRVSELFKQGLPLSVISQQLGIAVRTVRHDLRAQGISPTSREEILARGRASLKARIGARIEAREAQVRKLVADGLSLSRIAAALEVAESTVREDMARLGLVLAAVNELALRRKKVAQLREAGATIPQMAQALGVSPASISCDIAALGLAGKNNSQKRMAA